MAWYARDKFGRALNTIFAAGNAGIVTDCKENGADIGSQFAAGNSGIVTGIKMPGGASDIGSHFAIIGGGPALGVAPATTNVGPTLKVAGATPTEAWTATPSGGTPAYTYVWSIVSQTGGCTLSNANTATVTVNYPVVGTHGYSSSCTVKCTVHDSGSHVATDTCAISFSGPP